MQGIAYIIDGNPYLAWPAIAESPVLDKDGNPTGEVTSSDNLQEIIAALPPKTKYELVTEEAAQSWWQAHRPVEELQAAFTVAIQARLDDFARTRGYDGILSAASYATDPRPAFRREGQYAVEARSATWAAAYAVLGAVQSGARPMPTLEEVLAELPVLKWPDETA